MNAARLGPLNSTQLSLRLPAPPRRQARSMARRTDGPGSHEAARLQVETGTAENDRQRVLEALRAHPGVTSKELAERAGLDRYLTARRLPECLKAGTAARTEGGPSGQWRWFPIGGE